MKRRNLSLMALALGSAVSYGSWTCSALCGWADGEKIVALSPQLVVFGEAGTPRQAYDAALASCATKTHGATALLVHGSALAKDRSEMALMNNYCVKN